MNTKFLRVLAEQGLFFIGVYIGVAIIVAADVGLSLAAIDVSDPRTIPEMRPEVRYLLIPVVGTVIAIVAALLNMILGFIHRRNFARMGWFMLGAAYSTILSILPLLHVLRNPAFACIVGIPLIVFSITAVRIGFGKKIRDG